MEFKKYAKINVSDYELSRVQDAVNDFCDQFALIPFLNGVFVKDMDLIAGQDNLVETKLQRPWRTWTLMRKNAQSDVWEGSQTDIKKFLNLNCAADVTVSLWVA